MFDAIVATCMRHGVSPQLFPARQMHTIVSLVSGGIGVALVPQSVTALHREGVVYRAMRGEKTVVETIAVWRRTDDSPLVKALLTCLPKVSHRAEGRSAATSNGAKPRDRPAGRQGMSRDARVRQHIAFTAQTGAHYGPAPG